VGTRGFQSLSGAPDTAAAAARGLLSGVLVRQSFPDLRLSCLLLVSLCLRLAHDRVENVLD